MEIDYQEKRILEYEESVIEEKIELSRLEQLVQSELDFILDTNSNLYFTN